MNDVQWPVDNAMRPGFQILANSVVAGRSHEEPMIVETPAVDRQSTLVLRPITKIKMGGGARRTRMSGTRGAASLACCILVINRKQVEEEHHSGQEKKMDVNITEAMGRKFDGIA
jgi:hypothetical protein